MKCSGQTAHIAEVFGMCVSCQRRYQPIYSVSWVQRADFEAAQVYDDFVAEFGGDADRRKPTTAFVTGGTIQPGSRPSSGESEVCSSTANRKASQTTPSSVNSDDV